MTYYMPPRRRSISWNAAVAIMVTLLVLIFITVMAAVRMTSSPSSQPLPSPTVSTSSQWLDAVCKPGEVIQGGGNGEWLTGADGGHDSCGASQGHGWIYAGQYSSESLARHDARIMQITGSTAMVPDTGGYMLFTNPTDPTGVSLEPLTQFGFTITMRQGYSPDIGW